MPNWKKIWNAIPFEIWGGLIVAILLIFGIVLDFVQFNQSDPASNLKYAITVAIIITLGVLLFRYRSCKLVPGYNSKDWFNRYVEILLMAGVGIILMATMPCWFLWLDQPRNIEEVGKSLFWTDPFTMFFLPMLLLPLTLLASFVLQTILMIQIWKRMQSKTSKWIFAFSLVPLIRIFTLPFFLKQSAKEHQLRHGVLWSCIMSGTAAWAWGLWLSSGFIPNPHYYSMYYGLKWFYCVSFGMLNTAWAPLLMLVSLMIGFYLLKTLAGFTLNPRNRYIGSVIVAGVAASFLFFYPAIQGNPSEKTRALCKALIRNDERAIDDILKKGGNINAWEKKGMTPLRYALDMENKKIFELALRKGGNPNIRTSQYNDYPVIFAAADKDDPAYLSLVLKYGGNPNYQDTSYNSPLHYICGKQYSSSMYGPEKINMLLAAGADINHQELREETPLNIAIQCNRYDLAYLLLKSGADYTIRDSNWNNIPELLISKYQSMKKGDDSRLGRDGRRLSGMDPELTRCIDFLKERGVKFDLTTPVSGKKKLSQKEWEAYLKARTELCKKKQFQHNGSKPTIYNPVYSE